MTYLFNIHFCINFCPLRLNIGLFVLACKHISNTLLIAPLCELRIPDYTVSCVHINFINLI